LTWRFALSAADITGVGSPGPDRYAPHVLARLADFFAEEAVSWPRRLWDVGSLLALEELWESGRWEAVGVLSPAATDWQRNELRKVIGPDVGLGERELRRQLTGVLDGRLPDPSPARRRLRQIIDHARNGYLERWALPASACGARGSVRHVWWALFGGLGCVPVSSLLP
jgi:hypothetical protein